MTMKRKKGYFSISAVAEMFTVHQQTIRLYEKEGLISPKRSDGNTRLFSEEDVEKLEEIIYLTHQLGINLAGVEMVLKLQKKIKRLQKDMNKVLNAAQEDLINDEDTAKQRAQMSAKRLAQMKKASEVRLLDQSHHEPDSADDASQWEIKYEDEE